jgi:hypothetical protein
MLQELHTRGYERLRLSSGISPSGLHWRYSIAPAGDFEPNGYLLRYDRYPGEAAASTAGADPPFGWQVSDELSPHLLADHFLESFPRVAAEGFGRDRAYAQWLRDALTACAPDGAPIMYGEFVDAAVDGIDTNNRSAPLPLPPS